MPLQNSFDMPAIAPKLLLTAKQASDALAISPRKLWSLTSAGKLPCVRIGRSVRYCLDDLHEWIESQKE